MPDKKNLLIGKHTHQGKVRELNEDSFGTPATLGIDPQQQEQRGTLVAVADGMGGYAAGEVASKIAIETLFETYYSGKRKDPRKALLSGFSDANKRINDIASNDPTKHNMGTTLVAVVVKREMLFVANVGDSRAYLIRGNKMWQVTRDHSWVAEQVRARVLTHEQAQRHTYKNIITRAIGIKPEAKIDAFRKRLRANDIIVLCSDGLSNKVAPKDIQLIVSSISDPNEAAKKLVELANENGGEDNITAIVVRVPAAPSIWLPAFLASIILIIWLLIAYLILLALGKPPDYVLTPSPAATPTPVLTLSATPVSTTPISAGPSNAPTAPLISTAQMTVSRTEPTATPPSFVPETQASRSQTRAPMPESEPFNTGAP